MELITYRITLDTYKNGIQRTLQGFETDDKMSRRISINLVAGSDTIELPPNNVVAMMYVTSPNASEPSVNACEIHGNTVIYDAESITEAGITEMQLKILTTSPRGAKKVLVAPRFAVEVSLSGTADDKVEQTEKFTALENAIAKAEEIYNSRIVGVGIRKDCVFVVRYADGTIYESESLNEALHNGNALLSESYAIGGTGIREGEDTDNSKYYSDVSHSASEDANRLYDESHDLLNESKLHSIYTYFKMNFETGELGYITPYCKFSINKETGELEIDKDQTYTPEDVILSRADGIIRELTEEYGSKIEDNTREIKNISDSVKENISKINDNKNNIDDNSKKINSLSENLELNYASSEYVNRNFVSILEADNYVSQRRFEYCEMEFTDLQASDSGLIECYMDYPGGFDKDNCIVIGLMTKDIMSKFWRTVFFTLIDPPTIKTLNPTVAFMEEGIKVTFGITGQGKKDSISVRILLYKFE